MASGPKGAYDRAPIFTGKNYDYWKALMRIHVNSIDKVIWDAIQNGPNVITMDNEEGVTIPKLEAEWVAKDWKLWSHDWKAKNILTSALGVDEFYRVSHCETAKVMWEELEIAHEGTNDVK